MDSSVQPQGQDASTSDDAATQDDVTGSDDSGSTTPDTGTTMTSTPDGSSTSDVCDTSNPLNVVKYTAEAASEVKNGPVVLCVTGTCPDPNDCCYEVANPGNICVGR
jgi:hypothetical protein